MTNSTSTHVINTTNFFHNKYQKFKIPIPEIHFVLGSLFGKSLLQIIKEGVSSWKHRGQIPFSEVPGLKSTTAFSHSGEYHYFLHQTLQKSICFQSGRLHGYEGLSPQEVTYSVIGPKNAGTSCFVLSNISGSLTQQLPVGSVVAITDHINLTGQSPLCGRSQKNTSHQENTQSSVFIDMNEAYHPQITKEITQVMKDHNLTINKGIYAGVLGPQLETPAEVRMLRNLGADIVGMSTAWEVIALRYTKASVSAFSVISNPACGIETSVEIDYHSIVDTLKKVIQSFIHFAGNKL